MSSPSRETLDVWGIQSRYRAYDGAECEAPQATLESVFKAMSSSQDALPLLGPAVVRQGAEFGMPDEWEVRTEFGDVLNGNGGGLPHELTPGYHELLAESGRRKLIVAPAGCVSPPNDGTWGWAVQLYATRSKRSWGIGDLGDLKTFGRMARDKGAQLAMINPLHASIPATPQQTSPYFPSSRSFRNPIYISVESLPGSELLVEGAKARALNADRLIDRDEVWRYKMDALRIIWQATVSQEEVENYLISSGEALERYATFCVLVEQHGSSWHRWPAEYRHPSSPAVARFAEENRDGVRFHAWLQSVLDTQMDAAEEEIAIMNDLAIGVDPSGADAWLWQDALALDMRVGAPPDEFNTLGQNWGFPPFDPWRLRSLDYEPFISTVRASLASASAVRIDHALGLFRLFWIPENASPADGTYVTYPSDDLLSIVALESVRAGSYVVGEDLGTVEDHMRDELANHNVLSYKLLWFQPELPRDYPNASMAAITTHDLPTVGGLWTGRDLEVQDELELKPNREATHALVHKVREWTSRGDETSLDEISRDVHGLLGQAGSSVITATLEDAFGVLERPNYPGTTDEWPNWSVALPVDIEEIGDHSGFNALSEVMTKHRKGEQ